MAPPRQMILRFARCACASDSRRSLRNWGFWPSRGHHWVSSSTRPRALRRRGWRLSFARCWSFPSENRLLVRAGVGWEAGVVGSAKVEADLASPGGFALRTGKPVISNHLENEERFKTPELLIRHGIRRAMNVIL